MRTSDTWERVGRRRLRPRRDPRWFRDVDGNVRVLTKSFGRSW